VSPADSWADKDSAKCQSKCITRHHHHSLTGWTRNSTILCRMALATTGSAPIKSPAAGCGVSAGSATLRMQTEFPKKPEGVGSCAKTAMVLGATVMRGRLRTAWTSSIPTACTASPVVMAATAPLGPGWCCVCGEVDALATVQGIEHNACQQVAAFASRESQSFASTKTPT